MLSTQPGRGPGARRKLSDPDRPRADGRTAAATRRRRRRRRGPLLAGLALLVVALVAWAVHAVSSGAVVAAGSRSPAGRAIDPADFSPGACVEFAPTAGDRHLTVFLDAGHGGIDPGAVGTTESGRTIEEADETLPVELDTTALLRADGFSVVVSRTGPTSVVRLTAGDVAGGVLTIQGAHDDVAARDVCANDAKADILIGIYFDAGATAANAGSVTGYDAVRPFAAENLRLATIVQRDVLGAMNARGWQIPDEGTLPDTGLGSLVPGEATSGGTAASAANYGHLLLLGPAEAGYFSTPSLMPGALIEPLYITDPFEGSLAASSLGQHTIAQGLARAVVQYFAPVRPARTSAPTT